jgi:YteA family regulatory protein
MQHLTAEQLHTLRDDLEREESRLLSRLRDNDHYGLMISERDSTGDLSTNDNHPGDLGTEMFERGKDIALNENAEKHLDDVQAALTAMDNGQYGVCITCNQPIPFERLEAIPYTLYCIKHSPNPHINDRRPREEGVLAPPFGRTSLDERENDETEFDGEDAWQIVESWGNSNSPAMSEDPRIDDYDEMYIESDELVGYVEPLESFLATDIYGSEITVIRNKTYRNYMDKHEGDPLLEPDTTDTDADETNT